MLLYRTCVCQLLGSLLLAGCGGDTGPKLELAPAEGTVTFEENPLPNAIVTFYPETGRPATGRTDENGHFDLMTKTSGDGAMVGAHSVTVTQAGTGTPDMNAADPYAIPDPNAEKGGIPAKYGDAKQSGLTAEVTADGDNNFTFTLEK